MFRQINNKLLLLYTPYGMQSCDIFILEVLFGFFAILHAIYARVCSSSQLGPRSIINVKLNVKFLNLVPIFGDIQLLVSTQL